MNFQKWIILTLNLSMLGIFLSSCANDSDASGGTIKVARKSGFNPHHGPFDSRGNYREEWANNPPKRIFVNEKDIDVDEVVIPPIAYNEPEVIETYTPPTYTPPVYTPPKTQTTYTAPKTKPKTTSTYTKPKTTYTKPKTTTKPKVAKVTPKSKPPIIHVVKKGDTLYSLSVKYKSGIKTIQIANGLRDNTIRIGQKLKIPRY